MLQAIERALWAGDYAALDELAPCVCCCSEHTFEGCAARLWFGCRGSYGSDRDPSNEEERSWLRVYQARGMTEEEFYGWS